MNMKIKGALRNYPTARAAERALKNVIIVDGKPLVKGKEILEFLKYQLAMGKETI